MRVLRGSISAPGTRWASFFDHSPPVPVFAPPSPNNLPIPSHTQVLSRFIKTHQLWPPGPLFCTQTGKHGTLTAHSSAVHMEKHLPNLYLVHKANSFGLHHPQGYESKSMCILVFRLGDLLNSK